MPFSISTKYTDSSSYIHTVSFIVNQTYSVINRILKRLSNDFIREILDNICNLMRLSKHITSLLLSHAGIDSCTEECICAWMNISSHPPVCPVSHQSLYRYYYYTTTSTTTTIPTTSTATTIGTPPWHNWWPIETSHSHTHTHTLTQAHTHTPTHILTCTHTRAHAHTRAHRHRERERGREGESNSRSLCVGVQGR